MKNIINQVYEKKLQNCATGNCYHKVLRPKQEQKKNYAKHPNAGNLVNE